MPNPQPTNDYRSNHDVAQALTIPRRRTGLDCANSDLAQRCLRSCWRDSFNTGLPNPVVTHVAATYFDPLVHAPVRAPGDRTNASPRQLYAPGRGAIPRHSNHAQRNAGAPWASPRFPYGGSRVDRRPNPPLAAGWLHERVSTQLRAKRGARAVLNSVIAELNNDVRDGAGGPVLGVRLTLSGRLGKQKKGMAQAISRSIGRVPLSSLRSKVELAQGFVTTSLGCVGLKVWICYA